ncbi:MAG: hypothetical protein ABEJ07_04575 [Candidatus Nanohaloarchaea archaeon]
MQGQLSEVQKDVYWFDNIPDRNIEKVYRLKGSSDLDYDTIFTVLEYADRLWDDGERFSNDTQEEYRQELLDSLTEESVSDLVEAAWRDATFGIRGRKMQ